MQNVEGAAASRLAELCHRSGKLSMPVYTRFLTPPEGALALRLARGQHLVCTLEGGYPDAERVMACFHPDSEMPVFPIACLHISWDSRFGRVEHRQLLGSVLGLGIDRNLLGDICIQPDGAYLIAVLEMADFIAEGLHASGRVPVKAEILETIPPLSASEGQCFRGTVASLRLDAVLAAGLHLSRSKAGEAIEGGLVQVNHAPEIRTDAVLAQGDLVSVRGFGRLKLKSVGERTRKDRIPIIFESHGILSPKG